MLTPYQTINLCEETLRLENKEKVAILISCARELFGRDNISFGQITESSDDGLAQYHYVKVKK